MSDSKLDIASTYSVEGQDNPGEKLPAIDLENRTSRNPALFKRWNSATCPELILIHVLYPDPLITPQIPRIRMKAILCPASFYSLALTWPSLGTIGNKLPFSRDARGTISQEGEPTILGRLYIIICLLELNAFLSIRLPPFKFSPEQFFPQDAFSVISIMPSASDRSSSCVADGHRAYGSVTGPERT